MDDAADDLLDSLFRQYGDVPSGFGYSGKKKRRKPPTVVTCRNCGKSNLRWQNVKGGVWRIHEVSGGVHHCESTIARYRGVQNG